MTLPEQPWIEGKKVGAAFPALLPSLIKPLRVLPLRATIRAATAHHELFAILACLVIWAGTFLAIFAGA